MKEKTSIRIPGVTGFGHWRWLERRAGASGCKTGQVRQDSEDYTTPWIESRYSRFHAYASQRLLSAAQELEPLYTQISSLCQELALVSAPAAPFPGGQDEDAQRREAAHSARASADAARKREILIRLAELRTRNTMIDEGLSHDLSRASSLLRSHIAAYWEGVLKTAGDDSLPPFPVIREREIPGMAAYRKNQERAAALLAGALGQTGEEDDA